jgi:hypothetical protein
MVFSFNPTFILYQNPTCFIEAISKMPNGSFDRLMTLSNIEGPISASGLNRTPQNIYIYSCGYDPAPSLTSNHFSIFEMASSYLLRFRISVSTSSKVLTGMN